VKTPSHLLLCLAVSFMCYAGCGSSGVSDVKLKNDLKETGLEWLSYQDDNQKPPANWDELIAYAKKKNGDAKGLERVRDAKYDLKWNFSLKDAKDGLANTVLGEKPGGGPKLMMDGSVK
jgi:mannitol-specific phosphotransferase system IIBC component